MSDNDESEMEYAGFWIRVWAAIIDTILIAIITIPMLLGIYGIHYFESADIIAGPMDFLISWVLPTIAVIIFWIYKSATPGKMAISSKIVDAQTGGHPTTGQLVGRYFGYFISFLPLGLGIIWIAFDKKKQGWHDKLAGTVIVRKKNTGPDKVTFNQ